jgi:hypothetical protein
MAGVRPADGAERARPPSRCGVCAASIAPGVPFLRTCLIASLCRSPRRRPFRQPDEASEAAAPPRPSAVPSRTTEGPSRGTEQHAEPGDGCAGTAAAAKDDQEEIASLAEQHRVSPAIVREIIRRAGTSERAAVEREIQKGKARR